MSVLNVVKIYNQVLSQNLHKINVAKLGMCGPW